MKKEKSKKKSWEKPEVHALKISRDTFSGANYGSESTAGGNRSMPKKKS